AKSPSTTTADELVSSPPPHPPSAMNSASSAGSSTLRLFARTMTRPPVGVSSAGGGANLRVPGRSTRCSGGLYSWEDPQDLRVGGWPDNFSLAGDPAVMGPGGPLDRWLCVPAFRRVCPCQRRHGCQRCLGLSSRQSTLRRRINSRSIGLYTLGTIPS